MKNATKENSQVLQCKDTYVVHLIHNRLKLQGRETILKIRAYLMRMLNVLQDNAPHSPTTQSSLRGHNVVTQCGWHSKVTGISWFCLKIPGAYSSSTYILGILVSSLYTETTCCTN